MRSATEKAAYYVCQLYSGEITSDDESEFDKWLAEDKQHLIEYHKMLKTWDSLEALPAVVEEEKESREGISNARFRVYRLPAIAACLVVCLASFLMFSFFSKENGESVNSYQTLVGQQKRINLIDGSVITLNTDTLLETDFRDGQRKLKLVFGEAFFDIATNPDNPMLIDLTSHQITVLGTEFNVFRSASEIKVSVVEGKVSVDKLADTKENSLTLKPADNQATDNQTTTVPHKKSGPVFLTAGNSFKFSKRQQALIAKSDVQEITDWRDGLVKFNDQPLSRVVSELNRYSKRKVLIEDKQVMDLSVSGTFRFNDIPAILDDLGTALPISIVPYSDRYVILSEE